MPPDAVLKVGAAATWPGPAWGSLRSECDAALQYLEALGLLRAREELPPGGEAQLQAFDRLAQELERALRSELPWYELGQLRRQLEETLELGVPLAQLDAVEVL